jgi:hypothetical protein
MLKFLSRVLLNVRRLACARSVPLTVAALGCVFAGDAAAQTVQFTSSLYEVQEDAGAIRVTVSRLGRRDTAFSVTFAATDGGGINGAVNGQHYVSRTGLLTFGTNEMQKSFDIVILDNRDTNATRTVNLRLSNVTGAATASLGTPNTATINILDDETGVTGLSAGSFEFSAALYTATDSEPIGGTRST